MALSDADRVEIHEVISKHGHLCDSGELHRLGEVFDEDVSYDITLLGQPCLEGLPALIEAANALGDRNPVAHHVTNVIFTEATDEQVLARSKGLGVTADGKVGSVTYEDTIRRKEHGWRIIHRQVRPHQAALGK